jgi:hypothetical protein
MESLSAIKWNGCPASNGITVRDQMEWVSGMDWNMHIKWVNEVDPHKETPGITIEEANVERTVYLITEEDAEYLDKWLSLNFKQLFESELEDWYLDESLGLRNAAGRCLTNGSLSSVTL